MKFHLVERTVIVYENAPDMGGHWAVTPAVGSPYQGVKLGQV